MKEVVIAIDPGPKESAYVMFDGKLVYNKGLLQNEELINLIILNEFGVNNPDKLLVEMVASYGMPVGASVFETCVAIGRFTQCWIDFVDKPYELIYRKDIKMHHCGTMRAKNANVAAAVQDKYAPYGRNKGKGTKKEPGFFYGFHSDIWHAFALASYYTETRGSYYTETN